MKHRLHHNDIVNHRMYRHALYAFMIFSLYGCEISGAGNIDSQISAMKHAVSTKDFQKAHEILDNAESGIFTSDPHILEYNRAVIEILSGSCSEASERLKKIYENYAEKYDKETPLLNSSQDKEIYSEKEQQERAFFSQVHLAMALAELCPVQTSTPDDTTYREILMNLFTAYTLGLDVRSQIETVTRLWIPDCSTFIPESQKSASVLENALELETNDTTELTVCHEGVWLKYKLRAHEILKPSLKLKPLNRTVWLDDSSRLPFSQLHLDLHIASANGTVQSSPLRTFEQPLPAAVPSSESYESISLELPDFVPKIDGTYYVHLYTIDNGEAIVYGTGTRHADCRHIDDEITWTSDLEQKTVSIQGDNHFERLTLCPARPDRYAFELEPGQKAFFSVQVTSTEETDPSLPKLKFDIRDESDRELNIYGNSSDGEIKTEAWIFQYRDSVPQETLKTGSPFYVLVQNITQEKQKHYLSIENVEDSKALEYQIQMAVSRPCTAHEPPKTIPLNLKDIEKTRTISLPPFWSCPGQTIYIAPKTDIEILRTKTTLEFHSNQSFLEGDIKFSSIMKVENDEHEYPVETGEKTESYQTPAQFVHSSVLNKPMTRSTLIKESISSNQSGFSLISVSLNDDDDQKKDDSSDSKDDKKEDKKEQHDKTKKQDTPNKSPDKPSESPATPQGAGTDTSGEESQPDEKADGSKAAKYDPTQNEIDHIDALLDDIERGNFYVPLSGSENERVTDKDW